MRYSVLAGGIAAFLMIAGPVSVSPAVASPVDICYDGTSPDAKIAGCTEAIRVMTRKAPRSPSDKSTVASMYFLRGYQFNSKGDYDRALADFSEAIRLDPSRGGADDVGGIYNNRANVYISKGDYDRAIADCNDSVRINPRYALAYNTRGNAYAKKGDYERAIADYNEAIRLGPSKGGSDRIGGAYENRGKVYLKKGDPDRAVNDLTEATRLNPQYVAAWYDRGVANYARGDYDAAIADYSEAIRLDPSKGGSDVIGGSYYNRAYSRLVGGDNNRAIADYNEAIRLNPRNKDAYVARGLANLYGGALPSALADMDQATALDPKDAEAALWLDIIGQRSGIQSRLSQATSTIDMTVWPAPVIRLFLGQLTPSAVLAAAGSAGGTKGQLCAANFFNGQWALRHGDRDEALRLFRLASASCPNNLDDWFAANGELRALGAAP
jgi:tetratricopeptide (TPR) repeat protein